MREERVQKGQWIGLVAGTFFALTGTQKERKITVCPTTHLQDDVCVTALLVRIGLLREDQFLPFVLILPGSPQNRCGFRLIYYTPNNLDCTTLLHPCRKNKVLTIR